MSAYVFYCDQSTEPECLRRCLVGAPQENATWAIAIRPGDTLFLYNFQTGDILGPLTSVSAVDSYVANAWGGRFPVQVHFAKQEGYRANANPLRNKLFGSKSARPKHILEDSVAQVISEWLKESGEAIQTEQ